MEKDRRKDKKITLDEVKGILNPKQLHALLECQFFGWRLKFIRLPLFQQPVAVLYNAKFDILGVLESDGHINLDTELEVRPQKPKSGQSKQPPLVQEAPETAPREEKRKGLAPISDNLAELLSEKQMSALRKIETFGWQLRFVRRPLFQDPIPVILSPKGDKFAIVERDGRITMKHDLAARSEISVEQAESMASGTAQKIKTAK